MTDEPKPLPIGEAIEMLLSVGSVVAKNPIVVGRSLEDQPTATLAEFRAALAAFDGWGEAITDDWLKANGWKVNPSSPYNAGWTAWYHVNFDEQYKAVVLTGIIAEGYSAQFVTSSRISGENEVILPCRPKTRGDLLGLLHFLGVEL